MSLSQDTATAESELGPLSPHIRLQASVSGHPSQDPHSLLQAGASFPRDSLWWKKAPPELLWSIRSDWPSLWPGLAMWGAAVALVMGGAGGPGGGRPSLYFSILLPQSPRVPLRAKSTLGAWCKILPSRASGSPPALQHPTGHSHCGCTREPGPWRWWPLPDSPHCLAAVALLAGLGRPRHLLRRRGRL